MSLIKEVVELTVKDRILEENTACVINMKTSAKIVFELFWNNSQKTPQEICDLFGTDAVKAFEAHRKLQELIYFIDNSWVPLMPPKAYTENSDGTITITGDN